MAYLICNEEAKGFWIWKKQKELTLLITYVERKFISRFFEKSNKKRSSGLDLILSNHIPLLFYYPNYYPKSGI